jgi:arylsulfatase A-like enzyme
VTPGWPFVLAAAALAAIALDLRAPSVGERQGPAGVPAGLVAVFVIDGLRPDSIDAAVTPTLARLRREGTEYVNSHSVFPTVTRLNTATLTTGAYPMLHGIVGNSMFVPAVNRTTPFDTGDYRQLLALEDATGRAITVETLGEVLQRHGRRLVTASSGSTGNGFLLNPAARAGAGVAIHGLFDPGARAAYPTAVSDALVGRFGRPPPDPDDLGQMWWTDTVLRDYVLPELRPDVLIDWMGPLDAAQHAHGVGSPEALRALREIDASLARTIASMDALGLADRASVIVTSDHGFAHHAAAVNVVDALVAAGLKRDRASTDVVVASQSESVLFYVPGRAPDRVRALVRFLQSQPWVDVLFTAGGNGGLGSVPGTFSLDLIRSGHADRHPDVIASLAWTSDEGPFGVPGAHTVVGVADGPLDGHAGGHGGLNRWVVRNTFVAWGPHFTRARRVDAPVSLADIAPTALTVLGLPSASGRGRGRVLHELLADRSAAGSASPRVIRRVIRASAGAYRASVEVTSVAGHDYVDGGARDRSP